MHKQITETKEKEPQHQIYVVHPQCRGDVHRTVIYIQLVKTETVLICALSCRSFPFLSRTLSCRLFPSYKTLCALSCRGRPRTQLGLNLKPENRPYSLRITSSFTFFHSISLLLTSLQGCLFIQDAPQKYHGLKNHGFPKNQGHLQRV